MKNLTVWFLSALMLLSADVCAQFSNKKVTGSKRLVTKEVAMDDFKHLKVQGSVDVVYTQTSGKQKVEVYGSDNLVDLVEVKVKDNTLLVQAKKGYSFIIKDGAKLEVHVSAPMVKTALINGSADIDFKNGIDIQGDINLTVNGSGDIEAKKVRCADLNIKVNGSGDIELANIKATSVNACVNGSGDIALKGQCAESNLSVSGSGDISASSLKADNVNASVSGSGDITCHATKTLTTRVSGSGDIGYKGNPEITLKSKKGLYKIN